MKKFIPVFCSLILSGLVSTAQTYLVPDNGNTIVSGCSMTVKDPGGDNNFPPSASGSLSICPTVNGQKVHINFTQISLGSATLRVRNGSLASSTIIATITSSSQSLYSHFTSTDLMGCLTIEFTSTSGTGIGFVGQVNCVNPYPPGDLGATLTINSVAPFYTGENLTYSINQRNQAGTGPIFPSQTRLFLSTDSIYDATDSLIQTFAVNNTLHPGQTSTYPSGSALIPADMNSGNYYLLAYVDYTDVNSEISETNNVAVAGPISLQQGTADLSMGPEHFTDTIALGFPATGWIELQNTGTMPSGSSNMLIYLSADTILDIGDMPLDTMPFASIQPGVPASGGLSAIPFPDYINPGNYFLLAVADAGHSIIESNETNNTRAYAITLYRPFYDFSPQFTSVPSTIQCNSAATITCRINDLGKFPVSKDVTLDYYLSHDTIADVNDLLVLSSYSQNIGINGGYVTVSMSLLLPDFTTPGNYYLITRVDGENDYDEINELNNTAYALVTVLPISYDFWLSSVNASSTVYVDSGAYYSLPYTGVWNNSGTATASSVQLRAYLSTDTVLSADDDQITYQTNSFAGASSQSFSGNMYLPPLPEGIHYVLFIADDENDFFESNENNNKLVLSINIIYKRYDLDITGTVDPYFTGNVREVSRNIKVIYRGNTANNILSSIYLYLSADSLWNAADSLLTTSSVTFKGNDSDTSQLYFNVPNVAQGHYYLLAVADRNNSIPEINEQNNLFALPALIQDDTTDLFFTSASINNNAVIAAGSAAIFSGFVKDTSLTSSRVFNTVVDIYSSTDTLWQPGDTYIGTTLTGVIYPSGTSSFADTSIVPLASAGHPYIIFKLDGNNAWQELNESNNFIYRPVTISQPTFNVYPYSATIGGGSIYPTSSVTATCRVGNTGNAPTPLSYFRIYLSTDTIFGGGDVQLYSTGTTGIFPGANQYINTSVYMNNASIGNYYLLYVADATNIASESNETDNVIYRPITIVPEPSQIYDIRVASTVSGSVFVTKGTATNHYITVSNQSTQLVDNFAVRLYLSADSMKDAGDPQIGTYTVTSSIYGNNNADLTISGTVPNNTVPGNYYLLSWADATNVYTETNETNNYGSVPVQVIDPNLDLYPLATDTNYYFVRTVYTNYPNIRVANFGLSSSPAVNIGLYLSVDSVVDGTDTLISNGSLSALTTMGYTNVYFNSSYFPSLNPGNYFLIAFVDNQLAAGETNENNNLWIWPATVNNSFYDAAMENCSIYDTSLVTGQLVSITGKVYNHGNATPSYFPVVNLLSTDSIPDAGDVQLSSPVSYAPGPNNYSNYYSSPSIPVATAPGNYYIIAYADWSMTLTESNETNNYQAMPVTVGIGVRDVIIDSCWVDTARLRAGTAGINITFRARNIGNLPISYTTCGVYLSTDTVINPGTDTYLTSTNNFTLNYNNDNLTFSTTFSLGNYATGGNYYLLVRADNGESIVEANEINNIFVMPVTVLPLSIDLGITSFYLANPNDEFPVAGQTIDFRMAVDNYSNRSTSVPCGAKIVLSNDSLIGASDIPVFVHYVSNMYGNSSGSNTYSATYYLPNLSTGLHYFIYWLDTANVNSDPNLANNKRIIPFYVLPPIVDLFVSGVETKNGYLMPGLNQMITISNNGSSASGLNQYSVYLSADSTSVSGASLYMQNTLNIPAHSNYMVQLPNFGGPRAGLYYLIIKVDDLNQIGETNENNNRWVQLVSHQRQDAIQLLPDSTAIQNYSMQCNDTIFFTGSSTHNPLSQHTVFSFETSNDGYGLIFDDFSLTGSSMLKLYSGYSTTSPLVGTYNSINVPGIVFPQNDSITLELIGNASNPGSFKFHVLCEVVAADLEIAQVTGAIDTIFAGSVYSIQTSIRNSGTGTAYSSLNRLIFSSDQFVNGNDVYLSSAAVPLISANNTSSPVAINYTAPAGYAEGNYYLLILADADSAVAELDENNNEYVIPVYYKNSGTVGIDRSMDQALIRCMTDLATHEIKVLSKTSTSFTAQLYNVLGDKLEEQTTQNQTRLHPPAAGVYFVVVHQQKTDYHFKVIIS